MENKNEIIGKNKKLQVLKIIQEAKAKNSKILMLRDLELEEIPDEISLVPNIEFLQLDLNQIKDFSLLEKLKKLKYLSIASNKLKDIKSLKNLTSLESLILHNNEIANLDGLQYLKNLTSLNIGGNEVHDLSPIFPLKKLTSLYLWHNNLDNLNQIISLPQLVDLSAGGNKLKDISPISHLKYLEYLDLWGNSISDISPLVSNTHLSQLRLISNQITNIDSIASLTNLIELNLDLNPIVDFSPISYLKKIELLSLNELDHLFDLSFLKNLSNLKYLSLTNNEINNISDLKNCKELTFLNLSENNIINIEPLSNLNKLQFLNISHNKIKKFPLSLLKLNLDFRLSTKHDIQLSDLYFDRRGRQFLEHEKGIVIDNNPWRSPPIEILLKGIKTTKSYLDSLNKTTRPLNEVKVILVGEGSAGKTSLINRLLTDNFNQNESQTHGIIIKKQSFKVAKQDVQVHFWDFGGQEIMHSTHQFFLTERSIYVLVLDSRKEEKTEYWLKHIEAFGKQSPIIVVLNKCDENPSFNVNSPFLNDKYPKIEDRFYKISCKTGDGIRELKNQLKQLINSMEIRKQPFATDWFLIKEKLSSMDKNYITYEDYQNFCNEEGLNEEDQQKTLLGFLNDLGIVFKHNQSEWHDTYLMNPKWLTKAVYRIINSKEVSKSGGYLLKEDIKKIIHCVGNQQLSEDEKRSLKTDYPINKFAFIISMLKQFELCYEVVTDQKWMIPDLLPVSRKDIHIDFSTGVNHIFSYDFMPNSILPTLMVQLNRWILPEMQWRTGVVLKDELSESYAIIEADKEDRKLRIKVKSENVEFQKVFLSWIRNTVIHINNKFGINVEEKVSLLGYKDEYVSYQELIDLKNMGETHKVVAKLAKKFSVKDLLEGVENLTKMSLLNNSNDPLNIFISYSHRDKRYKDRLITALTPLIRLGKINIWQDGELLAGQSWNEEIMQHLTKAHIVVCLMSPDFIQSDFCYSIELQDALQAHQKGERYIIPIQIRRCGWTDLPIGKIQGIPASPISEDDNEDVSWDAVYQGIKAVIHRKS